MEVYLVRHTTVNVPKDVCYGQFDVPLAPTFSEETEKIIVKLRGVIDKAMVYSSPLLRCRKLAESLGSKNDVIFDHRLKELNFGHWEMKKWTHIDQNMLNHWISDYVNVRCPNGESYRDLCFRLSMFINDLTKRNHPVSILVLHAGSMRAFMAIIGLYTLERSFDIQIEYGEVKKVELK